MICANMNRMWRFLSTFLIVTFYCANCASTDAWTPAEKRCAPNDVVKIAVIDTGMGYNGTGLDAHLCKFGHKDFTYNQVFSIAFNTKAPVPMDLHGHGTDVVGLIDRYAKSSGVKYCIVVLKFYDDTPLGESNNARAEIEAIKYATSLKVDFINLSEGSSMKPTFAEINAVEDYLDSGGHIIASAGNNGANLAEHPFYPAMIDPRIVVVGALDEKGKRLRLSNYGARVNVWELGKDGRFFGTSQAAAITTGKTVARIKRMCYK